MRAIFISYRRSDSEGEAGRLFDDMVLHFGADAVFMDVAAIEPGRDFRKAIDQSVANCSVLLAVMGQQWMQANDAAGKRRLEDPNDFVRIELASALRREIPVVPVLVRGAAMPRAEQLPEDLKELAYRNAVELTHARWKSDVHVLIGALRHSLEETCVEGSEGVGDGRRGEAARSAAVIPSGIEAQAMERVSRELAAYIGPIAGIVVKRAAKRCGSAEELCAAVAREIDGEEDRAKFLRLCPR